MLWFILDMFATLLSGFLLVACVTRLLAWSSKGFIWQEERFWVMMMTRWVERSWCFIYRSYMTLKTSMQSFVGFLKDFYTVFKVGWFFKVQTL